MFGSIRELLAYVRKEEVVGIDFRCVDLMGRWHHLSLPASRVDEALLEDGDGFDASSVPGFKTVEAGDMVLRPDPTTAFLDPFFEDRTIAMMCDVVEASSHAAFPRDPRGIAKRAEQYMKDCGIADDARFGPEFEFYLLDGVRYRNDTCGAQYEIECREGRVGRGCDDGGLHHGVTLAPKGGYHAIPPEDQFFNVRGEIVRRLEGIGVPVRYHHHEVGSMGQQEIEVLLQGLTRAGDIAMLVKYFVRNVARAHGLVATFMPKPFFGEAGTGMHFHQHLFQAGKPLFYDGAGYANMSRLALQYIGGLLVHSPALLGLTNPSTNSFRRLVPGYEAPVNAFFSVGNRSAAIRIPGYATKPDEARMEFRPPDATCNPYLAMAAMLLAGLDGIRRTLDPTAMGFGPYDQNVFDMTEAERREKVKPLPADLETALAALRQDCEFLFAGKVFDRSLIDDWCRLKFESECQATRLRPHPHEIERLLDC